mmetsp:Transcript_57164/g.153042  ORF Transcript_57164/g.153042 Transcript_57164/m.153042 type:complete len:374 (+) Transcript_57164:140-1261(+)
MCTEPFDSNLPSSFNAGTKSCPNLVSKARTRPFTPPLTSEPSLRHCGAASCDMDGASTVGATPAESCNHDGEGAVDAELRRPESVARWYSSSEDDEAELRAKGGVMQTECLSCKVGLCCGFGGFILSIGPSGELGLTNEPLDCGVTRGGVCKQTVRMGKGTFFEGVLSGFKFSSRGTGGVGGPSLGVSSSSSSWPSSTSMYVHLPFRSGSGTSTRRRLPSWLELRCHDSSDTDRDTVRERCHDSSDAVREKGLAGSQVMAVESLLHGPGDRSLVQEFSDDCRLAGADSLPGTSHLSCSQPTNHGPKEPAAKPRIRSHQYSRSCKPQGSAKAWFTTHQQPAATAVRMMYLAIKRHPSPGAAARVSKANLIRSRL